VLRDNVMAELRARRVEFRRGTSGGGNQVRQPYLAAFRAATGVRPEDFPRVDHVHFFGFYIGNYPDLEPERVVDLCRVLNAVPGEGE